MYSVRNTLSQAQRGHPCRVTEIALENRFRTLYMQDENEGSLMFKRKNLIRELNVRLMAKDELIRQLTSGCEQAIVALDEQRAKLTDLGYRNVALQDELNAANLVVQGAIARVRTLEQANATAQEYVKNAQMVIMDQSEEIVQLKQELLDANALVEDYESNEKAMSFMEAEADATYPELPKDAYPELPEDVAR